MNNQSCLKTYRVAVLIPCLNEELTIAKVVSDFACQLPQADIYVFDNGSTDSSVHEASRAGARVTIVRQRGKGYVVQRMFRDVDADIYILVDGDDTYPADAVHALIEPILTGHADHVIGSRLSSESQSNFHSLNRIGNVLLVRLLNFLFGVQLQDILSGYRALRRGLVQALPVSSTGFEIEAELTIQSLDRGYRIVEVPISLGKRPDGSVSKLRRFRDGLRIAVTILLLCRDYKPLTFFGMIGLGLIVLGFVPGLIVIAEYLQTGLVMRLPSAVLAVGLMLSGLLLLLVGFLLNSVTRRIKELEYQLLALRREYSGERRYQLFEE